MGGTTKGSGWALFWFLLGFTVLRTAAAVGGMLSIVSGLGLIGMSFAIFKSVRATEEA